MIRKAEEKDIPAILNLLRQVLEIHAAIRPDLFVSGTVKYESADIAKIIRQPDTPVFVFTDEADRVLGYAFCALKDRESGGHMRPGRELYLDDLCVDESCRNRHIGRQLLESVIREARNQGCDRVTLNVWDGNDSAVSFYRNAGFRPVKTRMDYLLNEEEEET